MKKKLNKKQIILGIVILVLILIDQIMKIYLLTTGINILTPRGWGIGLDKTSTGEDNLIYILISLIASVTIFRYINSNNTYVRTSNKIVLSFAIAGIISNLIDRILHGYVLNYIYIPKFTTLNLSYIYFLVTWIGMAVILTKYSMDRINERKELKNGKNNNSRK